MAMFSPISEHVSVLSPNCAHNIIPRYNPFPCSATDENSNKFYDDNRTQGEIIIQSISNILNICKSNSVHNLDSIIMQHLHNSTNTIRTTPFKSYFFNIDGLRTNFNSFCVEQIEPLLFFQQFLIWFSLNDLERSEIKS